MAPRTKLAESMFLLLHDPFRGRLEVAPEILKCGLVAAELAELTMTRRVGIDNDRLVLLDGAIPPTDEVSRFVVESMARQSRGHSVRSWVEVLAEVLYEMVASRLVDGGIVGREQGSRRLTGRGPDRFPAVELLQASTPRVRLEHMLRVPADLDLRGAVLAAILGGLDVVKGFDVGVDRSALRVMMTEITQQLPADLQAIVAGATASAAAISLTVRR